MSIVDYIGTEVFEEYTYSWRDVALYNLSVGVKADELCYVYEKELKTLPTFATVPCVGTFGMFPFREYPLKPADLIPEFPKGTAIHMDNQLRIYSPLKKYGHLKIRRVISEIYDRGDKGTKLVIDIEGWDKEKLVFTNRIGSLRKDYGNFGGIPLPKKQHLIPDRNEDYSIRGIFPENAAALYRLNGDTSPLHINPAFAKEKGFQDVLLHGLCSLGYACRMLVELIVPAEPERVFEISNEFRKPAFPGDEFEIKVWKENKYRYLFKMLRDIDGGAIIDNGVFQLSEE